MPRAQRLPSKQAEPGHRRLASFTATPAARHFLWRLTCAAVSLTAVLILWQLAVGTLLNAALVATPAATFSKAWTMIQSGELIGHVAVSLRRVIVGYVTGCFLGILLGAIIGRYRLVADFTDPIIELIRPISPVALVPLAMLWFGIGESSKYFIIIYATIVVVLLNTAAGVSRTPEMRVHAARCLGATDYQLFWKVILPSSVPYILTGMRIALGFSFMGIVAAELIGAREGIGFLIMNSQMLMQTSQLFVGLLTLGILGLIVDRIFRALLARSMRRYMRADELI
jgi:ABC-type nitrate/sulfonate/bicarbonate transport system permease component